ncbi:MAG: hypothetical protein LKI39_14280 [Bacteroides sp.]|jgi:hypothetical protein|nr:hypothetical protein [Bacteroides sp.]
METKVFRLSISSFLSMMLLGGLLLLSQTLSAQEAKMSSEEMAQNLTGIMKEKLSLDDQQYAKIYNINLNYINKNKELQNSSEGRMSKFKTFKSNQKAKDKELKSVLSNEQYNEYQQLKEKLKKEFKEYQKNKK